MIPSQTVVASGTLGRGSALAPKEKEQSKPVYATEGDYTIRTREINLTNGGIEVYTDCRLTQRPK